MEKICDQETLAQWMQKYDKLIFSICYRFTGNAFDAQDLAQETFLSAFKHAESFDGQSEKAWLTRIAANKCKDYLKCRARDTIPVQDEELDRLEYSQGDPQDHILEEEPREALLSACRRLKPPYDQVAKQHFYCEIPVSQIAQETGQNLRTVQTQVYRAKKMLQKELRKEAVLWRT